MALQEDLEKQGMWLFKWRSYLPLLIVPFFMIALKNSRIIDQTFGDNIGDFWESIAILISFLGLILRCMTVGYVPRGTSGRNTQTQVAETLNTSGMYSIIRNPLYCGNFIIVFGITLFIQVWWWALIVWSGYWLYYERIIFTEEAFLRRKFGAEFISWAQDTPMIIPNFKRWVKPTLPFSFKTALRREYSTYFSIVASYFFLEIIEDIIIEKNYFLHFSWVLFFLISMGIYLTLLFLKKKTHILDVKGR